MRPSVSLRGTHGAGGRTSGIVGMSGPWCCLTSGHPPQRATISKTGGRLTQAPAGTNLTTGHAVVIFKTSSSAVTFPRSVRQVALWPVGDQFHELPFGLLEVVVQAMLSQYGFPWFAVRSTVSFGILFILCVLVVYFHVSSSSSCVSRLERWKGATSLWWWSLRTSRSSVSVLFMVLPDLTRRIVFGVAPPRTGRRKSPRRVCFRVTRRGPIGPSDTHERSSSQSSPVNMTYDSVVLSWPRPSRRGLISLIPSTTFSRGHRFGMAPNLRLVR